MKDFLLEVWEESIFGMIFFLIWCFGYVRVFLGLFSFAILNKISICIKLNLNYIN